jgi:hypothetical protein
MNKEQDLQIDELEHAHFQLAGKLCWEKITN